MGRTRRLMLCCAQTRTWHLCCLPPTGTFIGEMTLHYTFSLVINTAIEPTELLHNITRIHNITRLHFPAGLRACVWTPLIPDSKEWNMTLLMCKFRDMLNWRIQRPRQRPHQRPRQRPRQRPQRPRQRPATHCRSEPKKCWPINVQSRSFYGLEFNGRWSHPEKDRNHRHGVTTFLHLPR